jgi:large-conductance mechanosensitive channel
LDQVLLLCRVVDFVWVVVVLFLFLKFFPKWENKKKRNNVKQNFLTKETNRNGSNEIERKNERFSRFFPREGGFFS